MALVIVLGGSVLAGAPMRSGEQDGAMAGMPDCCKAAQSRSSTAAANTARLCCALNCTSPGTTAPINTFNLAPSLAVTLHSATFPQSSMVTGLTTTRSHSPFDYQQQLNPAYIRHLALLI